MKIALDVMGGDNAPDINVDGAKRALQDFPLIEKIYLVGREETVRSSCDRWGLSGPRVEIVPAAEVVEMNESGLLAVRKKKKFIHVHFRGSGQVRRCGCRGQRGQYRGRL